MSEFRELIEDLSDHGLVLCAMSKKRQAMLDEEPSLVDDLLDARHEQAVPGLLDLGRKGDGLLKLLSTGTPELPDSLTGRGGTDIDGQPARLLRSTEVKRIAAALAAVHPRWIQERCDAIGRAGKGLAEAFAQVQQLYKDAAAKDEAILVVVE